MYWGTGTFNSTDCGWNFAFLQINGINEKKWEILLPKRKGDFAMSKKKEIRLSELTEEEKMKYEVAEELGLLEQVLQNGWRSLSSKQTGKIGGLVTKKRREMRVDK